MIQQTTNQTLQQLKEIILLFNAQQYAKPLQVLNGSSIGMHVRHILEFYQCLMLSIEIGEVNYDTRNRDLKLETQPKHATVLIEEIMAFIKSVKKDVNLLLKGSYCNEDASRQIEVSTNLNRELVYNIEHMVHHLAIIKIGLKELDPTIVLNQQFGVAASTIRNKNICAQ
ncbi:MULTISPECIES: hypothetical protein [Galbibacter]|uniref:DinB family protein n=1 Tax=Galbibacter pacificus TaxID=2996052 RepID=A0ABT6FUG5_9FLAO|nr:hypothetical protein [Galbibacter pacificus]MDG3583611.1 hypothetical protein [Galbibacter pacificus]MDG3586913.1 hypothetical protein [Galbibacter pacificus]